MASAAISVELDSELQHRVERFAEARNESAGSVMRQAVEEYVSRMDRLERFGILDTSSPEFKAEYRRQRAAVAEHYRQTNFADHMEPVEGDLKGWV